MPENAAMAQRLPPLNALRAFESAARHLSFTRAAAELNVTQAAISHQVRALEARLGVTLFWRQNRTLRLTEAGQALAPAAGEAFQRIADAVARLGGSRSSGALTVSVLDSFAANWLVPRLKRFRARAPEVELHLTTSDHLVDFTRDDVDLAVRYGGGRWPGLAAERLMTEELFPVCSPALLEAGPPLERPDDLGRHTLLHDEMREDWRMWLLAAGVRGGDPARGPSYTRSSLVIQAAISGEGVALGRSVLVADALAEGRLVRPFTVSLPAEYAYYVVVPPAALERPKVRAFRDWIVAEAAGEGTSADTATAGRLQRGGGPMPTSPTRAGRGKAPAPGGWPAPRRS
ncbi:MAG: transcriptional regulator [Acidobacteria bacterium RIFCSPLOWO2_12_FULL_67_14b]|nr:MAG: transcriptional regulator [Acidobacteria bacterium RIFCSPLOWO2_12_FULL_67_14b]